ncbi:hypothetical protein [Amycolatopsis sp. NPDC021455]|uniref:GH12 family glycosyl hydrolase domain-containing protein n=1 Tax=Amycolatopsis sp. NPDC021455 TaxID=3154901 RepID=UPI0033E8E6AE
MQFVRKSFARRCRVGLATAALALVGVTVPATPAQAASACNNGGLYDMGKYWITNNLWGAGSGSGRQCIWTTSQSGNTISWGTSYSWSGSGSSVKSYDAAILGWHWGWRRSGTGLPVQLSANRSVSTGYSYNVRHSGGAMNVSYDMWLHPMANPGSGTTPSDEVMIWTYRAGGAGPAGTRQATVTVAGTNWDLYRGRIGGSTGWNVYSFVRTSNTTSATFDIRDFLNHLVGRGWMSSSKYLTSVQAGTEIFTGTGQLDVTNFYANVS